MDKETAWENYNEEESLVETNQLLKKAFYAGWESCQDNTILPLNGGIGGGVLKVKDIIGSKGEHTDSRYFLTILSRSCIDMMRISFDLKKQKIQFKELEKDSNGLYGFEIELGKLIKG